MYNKRGISPLIASVLLIVFVVTLLVVIFNLTRETVEEGLEKSGEVFEGFSNCDEVKFFVEDAFCGSESNIPEEVCNEQGDERIDLLCIKIKNEKNINFKDAFVVKFFLNDGETELKSVLDNTRLNAYEVKTVGIYRNYTEGDFGNNYKSFNSIELIPRVKAGDELKFCENKKAKIQVKNC